MFYFILKWHMAIINLFSLETKKGCIYKAESLGKAFPVCMWRELIPAVASFSFDMFIIVIVKVKNYRSLECRHAKINF